MTSVTAPPNVRSAAAAYSQSVDGCLESQIGTSGLPLAALERWLDRLTPHLASLREDYASGSLPLLNIADETSDIDAASEALTKLSQGADTLVFFGTGGSGLGGQTLAQFSGWNIPGSKCFGEGRTRTRFYDNLDPLTMQGALDSFDFATTRFVVTSKSGGTTETLAQLITTLAAAREAGFRDQIPHMFLGITEPDRPGKSNGLRQLLASLGIPMLEHHTGIGGRFSCLTNVGLMPALARGVDAHRVRAGARDVVQAMLSGTSPAHFAPALGAATMVALSKERGIRTLVLMPYSDRLGRFSEWYVQLWAESLGKGGEGTCPVSALGPLDQHSQLQLFMDGPPEIAVSVLRVACKGIGPVIDPDLAAIAGMDFMGGKTVGDVVEAQGSAIAEALNNANRPVRVIDVPQLDERAMGALLMHFMLETILAGRLLGLDPFDQPAVELAKVLTKQRLAA